MRQRSYGFSLTGVPLLVGLIYLPPLWVIAARLVAALLAALVQRTSRSRTAYTVAACLLDTVLMATLAHALLEPSPCSPPSGRRPCTSAWPRSTSS